MVANANANAHQVAIIGGGITGLSAAHRLSELAPHMAIKLYEASKTLGGVLQTKREGGYLLESAADCFIADAANPFAWSLAQRLGFADQLMETCPQHQRAMIVRQGQLLPVPDGFQMFAPLKLGPMLSTQLLSLTGKLRLGMEPFIRPVDDRVEETLEEFAIRRVGREAYQWIVQPLVGGIYTADPTKLSVQAALPQFVAMEREHGSLTRGLRKRARLQKVQAKGGGARYSMFRAPAEGMQSFVSAIAARLPSECVQLGYAVSSLIRGPDCKWELAHQPAHESAPQSLGKYDAIVVALSAPATAALVEPADNQLAEELRAIEHASTVVVQLGYQRSQIAHPLDAFGFVVPTAEGRPILAGSFSSNKFPQRAPAGEVLMRVFLGGALQPEMVELPDAKIEQIVTKQLSELLEVNGPPRLCEVIRWRQVTPQYHIGHAARVDRIRTRTKDLTGLELAGNAYAGIGIPQCVRSGEDAAERIWQYLRPLSG